MTAAVAAPGVEVTRALLSYTTRHKVSDAVAALLQSFCWLQASVLQPASLGRAGQKRAVSQWRQLVCT